MKTYQRLLAQNAAFRWLISFVPLVLPIAVGAEDPVLTVDRTDAPSSLHAIAEIGGVVFNTNTLVVSHKSGHEDLYPLNTIRRVWFQWFAPSGFIEPSQPTVRTRAPKLFQNQPNPAYLSTFIEYELEVPTRVILAVFSVAGAKIRTLVDGERPAGRHTVTWDGRNDAGDRVAAGVFFYRLQAGGTGEGRRMIILR